MKTKLSITSPIAHAPFPPGPLPLSPADVVTSLGSGHLGRVSLVVAVGITAQTFRFPPVIRNIDKSSDLDHPLPSPSLGELLLLLWFDLTPSCSDAPLADARHLR